MLPILRRLVGFGLVAALGVGMAGCTSAKPVPPPTEDMSHILKVAGLAQSYRTAHGNKLPASTDELKAWAKTLPADQLKGMGIDNLDAAFISPRDKQPYVLAKPANQNPAQARMGMQKVLFYEKEGANGKRWTASSMGSAKEMTADELKGEVADFK